MSHPKELAEAFEIARKLHKKHGKSYYFAARFFPSDIRLATYALYGFFRVPDEIVDNSPLESAEDMLAVRRKLDEWQRNWERAYQTGEAEDPVLRVAAYVFHTYRIPFEYSISFLEAMQTDLVKTRYTNYHELEQYMYGSAAVVGLMMTHVIGFSEAKSLQYAQKLGYAMQLTNFLRDIDEDYTQRDRIYMPQDELTRFGLSANDIAERRFSPQFRDFVNFQSERAHALYEEASHGIPLLAATGQRPVRIASALYRAILTKIASQDNNIFAGRARTRLDEKIFILAGVMKGTHV